MVSSGFIKDLAFLTLCAGFIQTTMSDNPEGVEVIERHKNEKVDDFFKNILNDINILMEKLQSTDEIKTRTRKKARQMADIVIRYANTDIVIELNYASAFLMILKYASGERRKRPLHNEIENFFNTHENELYEIISEAYDYFGEKVIVDTEQFCYKVIKEL